MPHDTIRFIWQFVAIMHYEFENVGQVCCYPELYQQFPVDFAQI